jgi:uncharacterized protein YecT (DUF1311 family)
MRLSCIALVASLWLAAFAAPAATSAKPAAVAPGPTPDCARRDLTQIDLNVCAAEAFRQQDRVLNALYAELVKQEDATALKQLQAAQRAWLQFRDLECVYETPDADGSIAPTETANCRAALTRERIQDFRRMLR